MVNYFELYEMPVSFHPDQQRVRQRFYELSRQFHPDRYAQQGGDALEEALKMSAWNNAAYKTLKDEDALMSYVLQYNSVLETEEKYSLPGDFLMDMMELNEAVSEAEMEGDEGSRKLAADSCGEQMEQLQQALETWTRKYDEGNRDAKVLAVIKDYYFRKKYLLRIQERIAKFATP